MLLQMVGRTAEALVIFNKLDPDAARAETSAQRTGRSALIAEKQLSA